MAIERSLIIIKPDAVQRGLIGEIISRFENKGLKLVALKMMKMDRDLAETHYDIHKGKPFFTELIEFITSSAVVAGVLEGDNAIKIIRKIVGATRPDDAEPGTIRGDYVITTRANVVHASDSPETAVTEITNFFAPQELISYDLTLQPWFE